MSHTNAPPSTRPGSGSVINQALRDAAEALHRLLESGQAPATTEKLAALLVERFRSGHKVMICGNGGSLCDAMHFAEELTGRFRHDRPPLPALSFSDAGHLSCTANDYGFEHVFSRAVKALGKTGDVLILLSTSGNSENCILAATTAKALGITTAAFLGKDGGRLRDACDIVILVPGETSDRIQELHMLLLHAMVERIELLMFPAASSGI